MVLEAVAVLVVVQTRGNATTFPLAWEDLLQNMQEAARQAEEGQLQLPHIGSELKSIVNVILKAGKANENVVDTAKIIHQARVRRSIVVGLVLDAKAREHPAYRSLEESEVYRRAATLPEDGVPTEIIALLPEDNNLQDIQRQKAATPYRDNMTEEQLREEFATMCKPNAVVGERTSAGFGDINAQQVSALEAVASQTSAQADVENSFVMHTGNRVLDQFEPWYFAFAFSYVFPYGCGMPDPPTWSPKQRCRSGTDAPRVELAAWMRCMARRCEAQINRDWVFGFSVWNLYFRSALNLSKSFNNYHLPVYDETQQSYRSLTPGDIEAGARQLVAALGGTYLDVRGQQKAVNGDVTKLAYVRNLKPAARKMLQQMRGTARAIPGTSEARRQMRFEIQAMRVTYTGRPSSSPSPPTKPTNGSSCGCPAHARQIPFAWPTPCRSGSAAIETFHHWTTTSIFPFTSKKFDACCPDGNSVVPFSLAIPLPPLTASTC